MKLTDEQILEWIRDERTINKGFKALMDAYQERLYHQIRRIVGRHEDTDDVLQNVFIKVYRGIKKFEGRSGLYTWLYRIAYNEAITWQKRSKAKRALSIDDPESSSVHHLVSSGDIDSVVVERALKYALDRLPMKQRQVFEMRYYNEMTYKDMSNDLGTTVGGLKASYHIAVKKIEEFISQINPSYDFRK